MKKMFCFTHILFCTLLLCLCMSPKTAKASVGISLTDEQLMSRAKETQQAALRTATVPTGSGISNNYLEYTITFNANYGTLREDSRLTTVNQRLTRLPVPIRDGYTFKGWYTNSIGGTQITVNTTFNANTEVYAQWDTTNINFTDVVISNITDTTASVTAIIPNCYVRTWGISLGTSNSYMQDTRTLNGFAYTSILTTTLTNLTPNTTYYYRIHYIADTIRLESGIGSFTTAKASEYTITFFPNGGTLNGQTAMVTLNQRIPALPSVSRQDYRFDGWYTEPYSGTPVTTDTQFHANSPVYAHWTYSPGYTDNNNTNNGNTANNNGTVNNNNGNMNNGTVNNDIQNNNSSSSSSDDDDLDEPVSVNKVKIKSVKNTGKGKIKVAWKWDAYADGYQIAYSQKKNFPSDKTKRKTAQIFTDSKTVSGLKKGTTYYVRVRAYQKEDGKKYYGAWSSIKKIKTKK